MRGAVGCYKPSISMDRCDLRQPSRPGRWSALALCVGGAIALALSGVRTSARQPPPSPSTVPPAVQAVLDTYCISCHNQKLHTAGLALDRLDAANPGANAEAWEKVIAKLRAGSMPPPG